MKKKCFFLILFIFVNISKEQINKEIWKKNSEEIISQIQSLIMLIKFSNYGFYSKYSKYFDLIEEGLNKIKYLDSIEKQIEELEKIIINFSSKIKDIIPEEHNKYINQLLNLFNQIFNNFSSNKEFIEKFITGNNQFIEEQKRKVDNGYIKREKANYDPNEILNIKNIEIIMFILILLFSFLLIFIGNKMIQKLKLIDIVQHINNKELIVKKYNKKQNNLNEPLIDKLYEMN